jgi:uncharacterized membrane protein YhaH (DUF805 family)
MNIEEIKKLLFTTEGRIGRKSYILSALGSSIAGILLIIILGAILGTDSLVFILLAALIYLVLFYASICLLVLFYASICLLIKRLHDRNRSGFFAILSFVPFVNIWIAIETIFIKGTTGTNEYGEDPLATSDFVQAATTSVEAPTETATPVESVPEGMAATTSVEQTLPTEQVK